MTRQNSIDPDLRFSIAAVRYAEGVRDGSIIVCKWIKLACDRFLDDLHWARDDAFDYIYDAAAAETACEFIEALPHVKGRWAARKELIKLEDWQAFMVCNIFGWLRKKDGLRRFRTAALFVPRKNAKSTIAACIGLYMLVADGEFGAEVYSGATTEKQAWEVFRPARKMVLTDKALRDYYAIDVGAKNLSVLANGARFEPIIGDPGDGASASLGIVDEYHEHQTAIQYETIQTGMGAREQPLMLVITTAGDNIAGPCYELLEGCHAMLLGTRPDDQLFAMCYGIDDDDDWTDPTCLIKANPNIDISVDGEFLRGQMRAGMVSPRRAAVVKTKHLNVWVQSREAYFNTLTWMQLAEPDLDIADFAEQEAILAIDLAEKKDLTALEIVFCDKAEPDPTYTRFGFYFCPQATVNEKNNEHLMQWGEQGQLTVTPGKVTDDRIVQAKAEELLAQFDIREVVFDPWHSRQMAVELSEAGATCVEFPQRPSTMNEPMRELDKLITTEPARIRHDGGKAFAWMLSNVVNGGRRGTTDLHRPDKEKSEKKIDGPVACIMALGRWLVSEDAGLEIPDDYRVG